MAYIIPNQSPEPQREVIFVEKKVPYEPEKKKEESNFELEY